MNCWYKSLTKNKTIEIEFIRDSYSWFYFTFSWTKKQDHAGLTLIISVLGFELSMKIYDNRNWNYEKKDWEE